MVCREYVMAGRMRIGEMDVLPVVEIRVEVNTYIIQSCMAQARPVGFALISPEGGYWLACPQDLTLLAHAVHSTTNGVVRAS
jgi:hypothetical protein